MSIVDETMSDDRMQNFRVSDGTEGTFRDLKLRTLTLLPKALCEIHGEVDGQFFVAADNGKYSSPALCPKCYVDWHTANIRAVTPVEGDTR